MTDNTAPKRFLDAGEEPTKTLAPLEGYEKQDLVSLEEAIKSIDVPIHNLDAMVWTAKRNSQNPSNGLTPDESASICLYTLEWAEEHDNFYTLLNQKLRSEKRKCLKPWFPYLKLFLTALYKLPSIKKTIWRGIHGNVSDLYKKDFIWWGVSSCTTTIEAMERFIGRSGERTIFMIECINGKVIKSHSSYQDENEILLMPGTYLTVIGKWSPSDNLYIIHLQEANPPYQLVKPPFDLASVSVDMPSLKKFQISKSTLSKSQTATEPSHVADSMSDIEEYNRNETEDLYEEPHLIIKQELILLNDQCSSYLDRIKYLEETNRQLQSKLDPKSQYERQFNDLRKKIDLLTIDKATSEIRTKRAEFDLIHYKKLADVVSQWTNQDKLKINSPRSTIEENPRDIKHCQRLMTYLMTDIENSRNEMKHLHGEISRLINEFDLVTMSRIRVQNEIQTLEEQIPFLSAIHEQEMNEFRNLSSPNIGIDLTNFYENELQRAIGEIRNDFENLLRLQRSTLEEYYRIKTDEIVQQAQKQNNQLFNQENSNQIRISINETKKEMLDLQQDYNNYLQQMNQLESKLDTLKQEHGAIIDAREREILELRSRLNELMASYNEIVSNKSSLEFEINTYRRLLEPEQGHVKKSNEITSNIRHTGYTPSPLKPITIIPDTKNNQTEMQPKTTFQRSAKGPINIDECSPDGKYIQLANTSKIKDIDLTGWRLVRKVDNSPELTYSLPSNFKLASGKYVKIHAKGQAKERPPYDLVLPTHDSWGVGVSVVTRLLDEQNEEKAIHTQKTVYAN